MGEFNGQYIVDNSALMAKRTCTLKWALGYCLGLQVKGERADSLAGKAIHAAVAQHRRGFDGPTSLKAFDDMYRAWSETHPVEERLSHANLNDILATYLAAHSLSKMPFVPIAQYVEAGITVPLCEGINVFALIDCPAQDAQTGALVAVDTKSTGNITAWWTKKYRLSSQLIEYAWAMEQAFQQPCERVYVDAIEMKKLPDMSSTKCRTHKVAQSECRLMHAKWELLVVNVSAAKKEQWRRDAIQTALECRALDPAVKAVGVNGLSAWPQEGMFNNGCTFCDYADFCAGDRSPQLAASLLEYRPWEPWLKKDQATEGEA